jgi:hypothetical protein
MTTKAILRAGLDMVHLMAGRPGGEVAVGEDAADAAQEQALMPELRRTRPVESAFLAMFIGSPLK